MKTRVLKSLLTLIFAVMALPMLSQDFMVIYLKNGDVRKFYMKNITEISASRVDTEGIQHSDYSSQCITTIYDKYVYNLEDVDSITFTKIDEEKAEQNFVSAMPKVFSVIEDCETIGDVESRINEIKSAQGVADAWSDGHQLYVAITEGEVFSFHYNHDVNIDEAAIRSASEQVRAVIDNMRTTVGTSYTGLKAVIANQQHYDEDRKSYRTKYYTPLKEAFERCGFRADYVEDPDVDFFYDNCSTPTSAKHMNIYDYDIVFLITHGSYGDLYYLDEEENVLRRYGIKGHKIVTSEVLLEIPKISEDDKMDWVNAYQTIHNWRNGNKYNDATDQEIAIGFTTEKKNNKWYHVGHPSISEFFFSNIAEGTFTNPNSIMFNTACQSLMGDEGEHSFSFAEQFTKRNLGVYLGYDESNEEGKIAGYHLFESMLNGMSLHQALSKLSEEERHDNMTETEKVNGEEVTRKFIANLRIYPENNPDALQLFLYPSYTEPVDNKTVTSSYEANHFIEVVGYTTTLDPKVLTYGFEYDTNALFTSPRQATKVTYTKLTEPSNKGNVQFKGRLTELEPDQIYYFRAYTYDGENYNYGLDQYVKYGKLSNLALSTDAVELLPGTQGVVEITSGNGVYDIDNSKETVASVKLVGNKIIIDALSSGKTIITITDTKSTQSTAITVTVWEKLSVAIIGNIDLEVGDRANVRILSGNNDYTLESSNPKVAMPSLVGEFVSVEALSAGTTTITVTDNKTDQTANFTVTVKADESFSLKCPDDNHPHIIDLGMPSGTKWACCNIGAGKPEDYGEYFAWGETGAKGKYNWSTYKYCDGSDNCYDIGMNISGSQYDVARAKWGTTWSMPNSEQMMELIYCCTHEWTTYNGVNGYLFTGSNGQSIFMPATGKMYGDWPNYEKGDEGNYWSSSRSSNHDYLACYFQFSSKGVSWSNYIGRYYGFSVRPITSGNQQSIPDLALESTSPVSLVVGESKMIKIVSGSGKYVYGHENNGIVSVDINGSIITINALKAGEIIVTITDTESGQQAKISVTVINGSTPMDNIPAEAVDLGLPSGTKWASYNVGATKPEEYGGYYAWGETEEKDVYNITTYAFYIGNDWQTCENLGEIAGTQYDVAHVKWGGNWTMPSANQIEELVTVCTSEWEERNGIKGRCFTGPNGKSIFLPAAGYRMLGGLTGLGSTGQYWTSSQIESDIIYNAYELYFFSGRASWPVEGSRFLGNSVRPVWNK